MHHMLLSKPTFNSQLPQILIASRLQLSKDKVISTKSAS